MMNKIQFPRPQAARARTAAPGAALTLGLGLLLAACTGANAAPAHHPAAARTPTTTTPTTLAPTTLAPTTTRPKPTTTTVRPTTTTVKPQPATTTTEPGSPGGLGTPPPGHLAGGVTAIGDSVMVDLQDSGDLAAAVPGIHIYGEVGRQWQDGETVVSQLIAGRQLTNIVVIELGLNGPIQPSDVESMMSLLSTAERVVFVNVDLPVGAYGPGTDWWGLDNDRVLASTVPRYKNAVLADWYELAKNHPNWFYSDGIHLDSAGDAALTSLIRAYI